MLRFSLILLLAISLFRILSLELHDLSDPTESRYGSVAQEMISSQNWIVPSLPSETGITPYLGKPPFHFWLIASCYKLFGVDEWSTRFPSFMAAILSLCLMSFFALKFFGKTDAIYSAVITMTSGGFFIFSGSSMVDVTLTMTTTLAIVAYALFNKSSEKKARYFWVFVFALGLGLGFLTKGPISLILVGVPLLGSAIISRDFSKIKSFPWITSFFIFLTVALPWFVLSEIKNPGFLKYFFWNENIARYLVANYGDRYGSGHQHIYGMSFIFLALCFLPWTPFVIIQGVSWLRHHNIRSVQNLSSPTLLLLLWALTPALFFAFGRQLHSGYILPCIPPLSLLLARFFSTLSVPFSLTRYSKLIILGLWFLCISAILIGLIFGRDPISGMISLSLAIGGIILTKLIPTAHNKTALIRSFFLRYATVTATTLCAVFIATSPIVGKYHSSETALRVIANESTELIPTIGIFTQNTFSHYWVASAWKTELSKQVIVEYFNEKNPPNIILVEQKEISKLPDAVKNAFRTKKLIGEWAWLEAIS